MLLVSPVILDVRGLLIMETNISSEQQPAQGKQGHAVFTFLLLVAFIGLSSAALFPSAKADVSTIVSQLRSLLL